MKAKVALSIKGLSVALEKDLVLSDVNVEVAAGRVFGLLGPSGAGKTTLMRVIVGLQRPSSGSVTIFEKPAGSRTLRQRVGYVTQAPSVYPDLTVRENLNYFAAMCNVGRERVDEVLRDVSLAEFGKRLAGSLSGGQRARVSLAVALLGKPELLVLDEPTVGLDPVLREQLWAQFHTLAAGGVTLLISSHVMDEAERCDELLLLRDGRLLAAGTPAELQTKTRTKSIEQAFLSLVEAKV